LIERHKQASETGSFAENAIEQLAWIKYLDYKTQNKYGETNDERL
jgi:hypothetical protein